VSPKVLTFLDFRRRADELARVAMKLHDLRGLRNCIKVRGLAREFIPAKCGHRVAEQMTKDRGVNLGHFHPS
jgi:hypothetical protein